MRRKILMVLLALGAIGGFGAGIAGLRCHRERRAAFERHVAKICVEAARTAAPPAPAPRP